MTIKKNLIIYIGLLLILSCLLPSFFAVLYGNGVLLMRWYIGFRIAALNWVVESLYTSEKIFDIIFCLIILGFGIFVANSAFSFSQHTSVESQGWQYSRSGYLSEAEHSYSLALFLVLKEIPFELALQYSDTNIRSNLKRAQKDLYGSSIVEELRNVKYQQAH